MAPGLQRVQRLDRDGLLIDPNTRIPGLVAAKTPAAELRVRPDPNAARHVAELKAKLEAAHDARAHANVALGVLVGILVLLALGTRSAYLARAAVLAPPAMVGLGLAWRSTVALFGGALLLALLFAVPRRAFRYVCGGVLAGALLVLWQWPVTNSLATIGPHPDGGHRFYGVTNQVETLLLAPVLLAIDRSRAWIAVAIGVLAIFTVGASWTGADGGGVLVFASAFAALALLRSDVALSWRRAGLALAGVVALALLVVGVDAAAGGTSHVTRAVGGGPGTLLDDVLDRMHLSAASVSVSWASALLAAGAVAALIALARAGRRPRTLDAMFAALVVSLLVNDSPVDVALYGALGALSIVAYERTHD